MIFYSRTSAGGNLAASTRRAAAMRRQLELAHVEQRCSRAGAFGTLRFKDASWRQLTGVNGGTIAMRVSKFTGVSWPRDCDAGGEMTEASRLLCQVLK